VLKRLGLVAQRVESVRCLIGIFDMAGGVATSRATVLDTPDTLSVGTGNFNFHDETSYFDITPLPKDATLLNALAPVTVRGTFAKPALGISGPAFAGNLAVSAMRDLLPLGDLGLGPHDACAKSFDLVRQVEAANARHH
jgi:uncharacterized protein involved in outer membrane biogenesis